MQDAPLLCLFKRGDQVKRIVGIKRSDGFGQCLGAELFGNFIPDGFIELRQHFRVEAGTQHLNELGAHRPAKHLDKIRDFCGMEGRNDFQNCGTVV